MKNQPMWRRFLYAFAGLKVTLATERSFRADVISASLVVLLLLVTRPAPVWWAILLLACGLVMSVELINTAVEKLVDHLHPDLHDAIKVVKDTLAGAVLVSCIAGGGVLLAFLWAELR